MLDVATGTAGVALHAWRRGAGTIVGIDLTDGMLRQGAANVDRAGAAGRILLSRGRAEALPFRDSSFDALTFSYLLRYVDHPAATLAELARVVKPGGTVASLEFYVPPNLGWRGLWWLYTRMVLPAGGLLTGGREWYRVGRFLGPSISGHYRTYPLAWLEEAWERAGMGAVGFRVMSVGGGLVMWGRRRG